MTIKFLKDPNPNIKTILVYQDDVEVGSMMDTCCSTILSLHGISHYIDLRNKGGAGGFLGKSLYLNIIKDLFIFAITSEGIKNYLKKQGISLKREVLELDEEKRINILKAYENVRT